MDTRRCVLVIRGVQKAWHCLRIFSCSLEAMWTSYHGHLGTIIPDLEDRNRALSSVAFCFPLHFFANFPFTTGEYITYHPHCRRTFWCLVDALKNCTALSCLLYSQSCLLFHMAEPLRERLTWCTVTMCSCSTLSWNSSPTLYFCHAIGTGSISFVVTIIWELSKLQKFVNCCIAKLNAVLTNS